MLISRLWTKLELHWCRCKAPWFVVQHLADGSFKLQSNQGPEPIQPIHPIWTIRPLQPILYLFTYSPVELDFVALGVAVVEVGHVVEAADGVMGGRTVAMCGPGKSVSLIEMFQSTGYSKRHRLCFFNYKVDGFGRNYQASVYFPLTSDIDKSQHSRFKPSCHGFKSRLS